MTVIVSALVVSWFLGAISGNWAAWRLVYRWRRYGAAEKRHSKALSRLVAALDRRTPATTSAYVTGAVVDWSRAWEYEGVDCLADVTLVNGSWVNV
jgi:hypothetical protein